MLSLKNISKALVWLVVHIIAFVLIAWIFLGLTPTETYQKFVARMQSYRAGTFTFTSDLANTGSRMGAVANHHLNEASERIDGHDPYERYNQGLDNNVRRDFNQ